MFNKIKTIIKKIFCNHDFNKLAGCTFENGYIMECSKCKTTLELPRGGGLFG